MDTSLKQKLYRIIFDTDTKKGKLFDISLLIIILLSIFFVMLESVSSISEKYGSMLKIAEWIITIIFSAEYLLRILIVKKPSKYIFSFYGIIDLLSFLPSYIGLVIIGGHSLMIIRALRLLRVFRILKISRYTKESKKLMVSLRASRAKISVFLFAVMMIVIIIGTLMYLIEGEENGFTSIPRSIYWAIVTLTTVGYGDIAPQTTLGQFVASIVMILGYAIIAVPTGIVSAELTKIKHNISIHNCPNCLQESHDSDATYCKYCGANLEK